MTSPPIVADALAPVLEAFGRLHPLAVHLPIGLVIGAFLVEAFRSVQRRPDASAFTPVALWIAAFGAAFSSVTGWVFAEGNGSGDDLFWHRWLGVVASAALVAQRRHGDGDVGGQQLVTAHAAHPPRRRRAAPVGSGAQDRESRAPMVES